MKAQMFLIGIIIIITALILFRNLLEIYSTIEEKRYQEPILYSRQLENIKREYQYAIGLSTLQTKINESAIAYLSNFSSYLRDGKSGFYALYLFIFVNSTNQRFSVTLGNFMHNKMNVTLNVTDSTPSSVSWMLDDKFNLTSEFQANVNGTINITLNYQLRNDNIKEKIQIESDKKMVYCFFDLSFENDDLLVRKKYVYNKTY